MASKIQIKRGTGSAVPSGLVDGELAINLDSGKLYYGSGSNSINSYTFTNITASGNISSSGQMFSNRYRFTSANTNDYIGLVNDGIAIKSSTSRINLSGNVTASGIISGASAITADDATVTDLLTVGRIRSGGGQIKLQGSLSDITDITASGIISGASAITGSGLRINGSSRLQGAATITGDTILGSSVGIGDLAGNSVGIFAAAPNAISFAQGNDDSETYVGIDANGITIPTGRKIDIQDTTAATDASGDTGALKVEGGISVAKNISVGLHITSSGNISGSNNLIMPRQFDIPVDQGTTQGDIIYYGLPAPDFAAGKLHYLRSSGQWFLADKDAENTGGAVILAFALGSSPTTDGMLLRGMFRYGSDLGSIGDRLYVGDSGVPTNDVSGFGTGDIVRIIGYLLGGTNGELWFNPDNTYVEKA